MIFNMVGGGGGSSTKSTLIVSIDTGSTVQAYSDSSYQTLVKTASEKSTGEYWLTGLDNGTYYIKATKGSDETTTSYTITEYGVYRISMNYDTRPVFTYTGSYELVDDTDTDISAEAKWQGDWKLRLLTSGTLTFSKVDNEIDVFLVGGGGAGRGSDYAAGGGGGYTVTELDVPVTSDTNYAITVGSGVYASSGGNSEALGFTANGGAVGEYNKGGAGGSGGGGFSGGAGGSDGTNGYTNNGGAGQGTTTREFGGYSNTVASAVSSATSFALGSEPTAIEKSFLVSGKYISIGDSRACFPIVSYDNNTRTVTVAQNLSGSKVTAAQGDAVLFGNLYAGGGGANGSANAKGGYGGGGNGRDASGTQAGADNTGGGGGGANSNSLAGVGGSGIVIIRNARS